MTDRTSRRWALWLLPLIVARFLLPPGVMPGHDTAGAALVLCSVHAGLGATSTGHDAPSSGGSHADKVCPFAAAASSAPGFAAHTVALELRASILAPLSSTAQRAPPSGPTRTQFSRAPPSLA
jgi:hypothetical protein